MTTHDEGSAAASAWIDLFREGRGVYTVLLNLGVILHGTNIFIVATVMPTVVADIGGVEFYSWPAMVYMIGTIVGASSGAPVRAAFGRRFGFVVAALVFLVGGCGCAVAPNMPVLLGTHLVQGIGGGLMLAQSMALVSELYSGGLRARILAIINTVWVAAALAGPAGGGVFASIGWWRGAFWATVPIAVCVAWLAWRSVPQSALNRAAARVPYRRLGLLVLGVLCVAAAGADRGSG